MSADEDDSTDGSAASNMVVMTGNLHLSDGVEDTWPAIGGEMDYRQIDDSRWRSDLAQRWVHKIGAEEKGVSYTIDSLPDGYCVFDRDRASHSGRDPFLFGHPSGRYFQSRTAFFPHFYWLVTGRKEPCKCHLCMRTVPATAPDGTKPRRKRRTKAEMEAARAAASADDKNRKTSLAERPKRTDTQTPTVSTDSEKRADEYQPQNEEGPEYWKMYIMKMKKEGAIDDKIEQPLNFDWALTHEWLEKYFVRLKLQAAFIPRTGEVVLWRWDGDNVPLLWNEDKKSYMIKKGGAWAWPQWRAGVITQVPKKHSSFLDITEFNQTDDTPHDDWSFRVETLPDPLDTDGSISRQYKYLPLKDIKPFNIFPHYIEEIPREELHPSIEYAMTTMASYNLLSFTRFQGTWPNARIYSRGMYVGHELIALQDAIRLKPFGLTLEDFHEGKLASHEDHDPVDVMVVEEIWEELEECNADPKDPQISKIASPRLAGKVYTRDPRRLELPIPFAKDPLKKLTYDDVCNAFRQVGMSGYGDWYAVAGGKKCVISPAMILGRCYEPDATQLLFTHNRLDYDLRGVLEGRNFSTTVDSRVPEKGEWFWGDCRVETLTLTSMNGVEVGLGAPQRQTPEQWQATLRILSGPYSDVDIRKAEFPRSVGRPRKHFAGTKKTSKLVSTGLGDSRSTSSDLLDGNQESESEDSEAGMSASQLMASFPFRGGTEESEGGDYNPDHHD